LLSIADLENNTEEKTMGFLYNNFSKLVSSEEISGSFIFDFA
jgi:hypothetical protein